MVWNLACVELVEQGSHCENVDGFGVGPFLEELLGHVGGRSAELHGSAVEHGLVACESEVAELNSVAAIEQDVVGLDIAMHDSQLMQIGNDSNDLQCYSPPIHFA